MVADDINRIESESGIIATLIHHPDYIFYSDNLLPAHFTDINNQCVYAAIQDLASHGIQTIDPYNIMSSLESLDGTKKYAENITIEMLNELIEMSDVLERCSVEEYMLLVSNVLDAAFRRDVFQKLRTCEKLCYDLETTEVEQKVYDILDDVMMEYTSTQDVPQYKDVVDECWEKIKERQNDGYAGIPFKFPTLNQYATLEPGELFIFGAEAKQGKSMILLNCAIDLLMRGKAVLYLDSELNTRLFTARVLAHLTGIEYRRLTNGAYTEDEARKIDLAREWMKTRKFTHLYIPTFDTQTIYTTVKKVYHTQGIDVLIVDYFKSTGDGDAFASYQELGNMTNLVKNRICGDMDICGLGAAQANATGKLADSAKIGRNASTIAMITDKTPEEIEEDGPECGNKKLRVVLNRNGMQHASGEYIDLIFQGNNILYEEAKQHAPQEPF